MTTVLSSGAVGFFTLVRILPKVSTVLNTVLMLYPFQDPPDLLAQSFDVGNFSGGECFFDIFAFLSWFQSPALPQKTYGVVIV